MLTAELITDISELDSFQADWRRLAVRRSNAFITPEWFNCWWEAQGSACSTPLVSVVRRSGGAIAGVVPLVLDRSSLPRAIRFAGASLGDRFHPAAERADDEAVVAATVAALEDGGYGRRMLLFERTNSEGVWWRAPHDSDPRRRALIVQQETQMPFIDLRAHDWNSYLQTRSQRFRKQVRRAERTLLDERGMELRATTAETLEADLIELFRLHDLRRASLGGSSLGLAARRSLCAFAGAALEQGWLRLSVLECERRQIASFLGWRVGDVFASYQGGFDPAWSKLSVGFAIEAMLIREAIEEGAQEYDFLLGTETWKRRFTDEDRASTTVALVAASRPMQLLVAAEAKARRVARRAAQRPGVGRVVRGMHGIFPAARRV